MPTGDTSHDWIANAREDRGRIDCNVFCVLRCHPHSRKLRSASVTLVHVGAETDRRNLNEQIGTALARLHRNQGGGAEEVVAFHTRMNYSPSL